MLLHFAYFLVITALLSVPAYFIGVIQKLRRMKDANITAAEKLEAMLFIPFGPAIVAFNCLADCLYFWKNNFRKDLKLTIIPKDETTVNHQSIRDIQAQFIKYNNNKIKTTHSNHYVKLFIKKLNVNQNLQFLLFGQLIPVGGFASNGGFGGKGKAYTYKSMKTNDLREVREEEIQRLDDTH
jgi:heme/copper-type cytochrome/quinol oxidase subunit 1